MDKIIYGKDITENIVSIEVDSGSVTFFKADGSSEVRSNSLWILADKNYGGKFQRLKGDGHYKYIAETTDRDKWENARKKARYTDTDLYTIYDPKESYMVKTGVTYFKNTLINEVPILSFDIEGTGLTYNNESRALLIANTFRDGKGNVTKKLFSVDEYDDNDALMLADWCRWVRQVNPALVIGHNIFGYDLPYLQYVFDRNNVAFELGRDGSNIKFNSYTSSFRKDGSQTYDYNNAYIYGRELVDTMFLAIKYDAAKKKYESYGLKSIIKQEGLEKKDRVFVDASKMKELWQIPEERKRIKQYALDDSDDALKLFDLMAPPFFYMNRSIPKSFQQVINGATGSQINSMMVRSYLQDGHSIPQASDITEFQGAISAGYPGIYKNAAKADIASLYPSIIRQYEIHDEHKDPKKHFLHMINFFTEDRLKNKKIAKETGDSYYENLNESGKIFINSGYGFLGAKGLNFNYPKGASLVTKYGREILEKGVKWASGQELVRTVKYISNKGKPNEEIEYEWSLKDTEVKGKGFKIINLDTDSFTFCSDKKYTDQEFGAMLKELNSLYPEKIKWEPDGMFEKVIVLKAKNYILYDGKKIKIKGSSLKDSKKEKRLQYFIADIIQALIDDKDEDYLLEMYNNVAREINQLDSIENWCKKITVTKKILNPERTNEEQVLVAINGRKVQEGDKVWIFPDIDGERQEIKKGEPVYLKKTGEAKMIPNKVWRHMDDFNGSYDKDFLYEKLNKTINIFSSIINVKKFPNYSKSKQKQLLDKILKG